MRALSVLTVHFGERDRVGSRLRADDLMQLKVEEDCAVVLEELANGV